MPTLGELFNIVASKADKYLGETNAGAALRGVTSSITLGLDRYPAAVAMMLIDKAVGEGKLSYEEAQQLIQEQKQRDREERAVARTGGEIVGLVSPTMVAGKAAARVATAATPRVAGPVGRAAMTVGTPAVIGAGQGAVSAYTENRDISDVGLGAALGGVGGAIGGTVQVVANKAVRTATKKAAMDAKSQSRQTLNRIVAESDDIQRQATRAGTPEAAQTAASVKVNADRARNILLDDIKQYDDLIRNANNKKISDAYFVKKHGSDLLGVVRGNVLSGRGLTIGNTLGGVTGLGAMTGAGIGALLAEDPLTGALKGAGGGSALPLLVKFGAAGKLPQRVIPGVGVGAGVTAGRTVAAQQPSTAEPIDLSGFEVPEEELDLSEFEVKSK